MMMLLIKKQQLSLSTRRCFIYLFIAIDREVQQDLKSSWKQIIGIKK